MSTPTVPNLEEEPRAESQAATPVPISIETSPFTEKESLFRPSFDSARRLPKKDAATRETSIGSAEQCVLSCPEFEVSKSSPLQTPDSLPPGFSWGNFDLPAPPNHHSYSQPGSPGRRRSRLALRFRRLRPWGSFSGAPPAWSTSSDLLGAGEEHHLLQQQRRMGRHRVRYQTGKQRRRRAQESEWRWRSSLEEADGGGVGGCGSASPNLSAEDGSTRPLAMAGVMLAASDLDRLSSRARATFEARRLAGESEKPAS